MGCGRAGQRGIALIAVLWVTLLLGLVAAAFLRETRTGVNLARNSLADAKAEALADAGVSWALLGLLTEDESAAIRADGRPYRFDFAGGSVAVEVQDEGGKIDLNQAAEDLLQSLFLHAGAKEEAAAGLAAALVDFRDADQEPQPRGAEDPHYARAGQAQGAKDAPLTVIDELQQVMGVTPELFARLEPLVTVHSPRSDVDLATAPAAVLRALPGMTEQQVEETLAAREADGERVAVEAATITVEVTIPGGGHFVRRAVVRRGGDPAQPFEMLDWRRRWAVADR
jgi:general secretion pathway protein K